MKNIPTPDPQSIPEEDLLALSTRWLEMFEASARAQDVKVFKGLFHPDAILYGIEKGGAVDWPLTLSFSFDIERAKILVAPPSAGVIVEWVMKPLVVGGPDRNGRATLFLTVEGRKGREKFLCVHGHFSLRG